jgi:phosphatidate cytidylyltransferase
MLIFVFHTLLLLGSSTVEGFRYFPSSTIVQKDRHRPRNLVKVYTPLWTPNSRTLTLSASSLLAHESTLQSRSSNVSSGILKRVVTSVVLVAGATSCLLLKKPYIFAATVFPITLLAQNEFSRLVQATGSNILSHSVVNAISAICCLSAVGFPAFHEFVVPAAISFILFWSVFAKASLCSIKDISSTLFGIIYLSFLPSYWIRVYCLNLSPTAERFSSAVLLFWTWSAIAVSDSSAFFVGKLLGKHKLSEVSNAAGQASPNKTVEGAVGGLASCLLVSLVAAYHMGWPYWEATGLLYGLMLFITGFVGDLAASLMKRDAGVKDSGSLLPGHGGILDRTDSYLLNAPLVYYYVTMFLPFISAFRR